MAATSSIDHRGRRLAWRVDGSGPTLLLLQGYGGTSADWDPTFLGLLAESFRVIRPDPRGMGDSTFGDPAEPLTIASMADDALTVLDAVGGGSAVVVGWSMGGMVAQALACAAPDRVRALVLLGTDPGPGAVVADAEVWRRLTDTSGSPREQASRLLHLLFSMPLADAVDAEVGDLVADARAALDPQVLRAQEAALVDWHVAAPLELPTSNPPVVVVAGEEDVVIPAANAELVAARWPGATATILPGAGHAVMAQFPAEVVQLIRAIAG